MRGILIWAYVKCHKEIQKMCTQDKGEGISSEFTETRTRAGDRENRRLAQTTPIPHCCFQKRLFVACITEVEKHSSATSQQGSNSSPFLAFSFCVCVFFADYFVLATGPFPHCRSSFHTLQDLLNCISISQRPRCTSRPG